MGHFLGSYFIIRISTLHTLLSAISIIQTFSSGIFTIQTLSSAILNWGSNDPCGNDARRLSCNNLSFCRTAMVQEMMMCQGFVRANFGTELTHVWYCVPSQPPHAFIHSLSWWSLMGASVKSWRAHWNHVRHIDYLMMNPTACFPRRCFPIFHYALTNRSMLAHTADGVE